MAPLFRIFLASPGDVATERAAAHEVIADLRRNPFVKQSVALETVAWDEPGGGAPMLAQLTPQEAIAQGLPLPSQCEIVIVILWARIGTTLAEDSELDPHAKGMTGTQWEFEEALRASLQNDKPDVLLYRRRPPPSLRPDDPRRREMLAQWDRVEAFFARLQNPDGTARCGINEYATPEQFKDNLKRHLETRLFAQVRGRSMSAEIAPAESGNGGSELRIIELMVRPPNDETIIAILEKLPTFSVKVQNVAVPILCDLLRDADRSVEFRFAVARALEQMQVENEDALVAIVEFTLSDYARRGRLPREARRR